LTQEEDALAAARGEIATILVALYRSLRGGWRVPVPPPPEA